MREEAQMCYTDETEGENMLITTIGINGKRDQHIISTINVVHLADDVNLLEDGEGVCYISYKLSKKPSTKNVYMGWSKTLPVPAKPLHLKGFAAKELAEEVQSRKNPIERLLNLYILDGNITRYGNVYICDAMLLAEPITAIITIE